MPSDYQAVAAWKWLKEGQLNPTSFMKPVTSFARKHLTPLDAHPIQTLRFMRIDGFWQLSEAFCQPGVFL